MWKNVLDAFIIIVLAALFVHALMSQNGKKRSGPPKKDDQDVRIFFLPSTSPGPQNQKFLFMPN